MYYKDGDLPSTAVWVTDTDLDGTPAVQTPALNPDTGRLEAAWPMLPVKDLDGKTWVYIVKEVTAAGEEFTADAAVDHFTQREEGLEVTNTVAAKPVTFSKTEVNSTAELPGATLQVFRGETADAANLVEEWVSTDTAKVIELTPGIYTMVETTAPKGYEIAESITFRVNLDGIVDIKHAANWVPAKNATVRMQDAKTPEPAKPVDPSYPTLRVPLSARKTLINGSLKAGEFTFLLKDCAGRVIAEASNDAQGVVTFPDRTFSRVVKNYKYTIEEKPGDATMNTILLLVMLALTLGAGSLVLRRIQRTQEHKNQR
ncbi:MAG: Cna B-type domain-containing protein [Clostridiales bacterium]|nr:Cna B-type domain-containing protein [Clostridiales bacterium]